VRAINLDYLLCLWATHASSQFVSTEAGRNKSLTLWNNAIQPVLIQIPRNEAVVCDELSDDVRLQSNDNDLSTETTGFIV